MKSILIVEDNESDAELTIRSIKRNFQVQIELVRTGDEAVDYLFSENKYSARNSSFPSLILLDLKLPRLDGSEVLRIIKNDPRTKNIPVVIFSSSELPSDIECCYSFGANSYVSKPVDYVSYNEALKDVCFFWLVRNLYPE